MIPPAAKVSAEALGIPVHQPTKLNDGSFEMWLKDRDAEIGVLVAYGRLLKQPLLDLFPNGILNMHPSLLPRYRGPSPIQSAVLNGDTETGVTIMRLELEMDAGDVLLQETMPISEADTNVTMSEKLARRGAEMMIEGLAQVASGTAQWTSQDESQATYCGMIKKSDGRIDWNRSVREIHNQVRGSLPWPAAQCLYDGQVYKIHRSQALPNGSEAEPGTVTSVAKDHLCIATGDGTLAVYEIQAPGKRAMAVAEYMRGHAVDIGMRFETITD